LRASGQYDHFNLRNHRRLRHFHPNQPVIP
jgi:hypothetical protein